MLHGELQSVSSKLTDIHISMIKRFPLYAQKALTSKRKKGKQKGSKKQEGDIQAKSTFSFGNLSSVIVASQIFYSIQRINSFTAVERINADYTKKLACKAAAPSTTSTECLEQIAAILNARNQGSAGCSAKGTDAQRGVEMIESDDEVKLE